MPSSVKELLGADFQPITSSNFSQAHGRWLVVIEMLSSFVICYYINAWYYFWAIPTNPWFLLLLPLNILGNIMLYALIVACVGWIILQLLRAIEPPKEGMFPIDGREFRYYCRRFMVCYYSAYLFRSLPIPWADMVAFRMFGVKVGKNVVLYDAWVDPELIEIGDFVMLSLNAALISHCVYQNHFYVKKVVVSKNCIVGTQSVVAPGTFMEEGAILGGDASTIVNQRLEGYMTHVGNPAWKKLPIKVVENASGEKK